MHRLTVAAAALALLVGMTAAADAATWTRQSPVPTGFVLNDVELISQTEAWAVGGRGTILHTTDGGVTWTRQASGTTEPLHDVRFKDALHGWTVGPNLALYTVDGGRTWRHGTGLVGTIRSVDCADLRTCFAGYGGRSLFRSLDGGATWSLVSVPLDVQHVQFFDSQRGVVSGAEGAIHTTDGGKTWSARPGPHGGFFVDPTRGFMASGSVAETTADGGATWQRRTVPAGTFAYDVFFLDAQRGWAVGIEHNVIRTTDGGTTWQTLRGGLGSGNLDTFWSVEFVDPLHGMIVGSGGFVSTTSDGGLTWQDHRSGYLLEPTALASFGPSHLWAPGPDALLLATEDAGEAWDVRRVPFAGGLSDAVFVSERTGWVTTTGVGPGGGFVFKTEDGGRTWQNQGPSDSRALGGIEALDERTLVAVGSRFPVILRSTDAGASWTYVPFSPPGALAWYGIDSPDGRNVWAVGENGMIVHSGDGGLTWKVQRYVYDEELYEVSFSDARNGWASGWNGLLLRTTDGGLTWVRKDPGTTGAVLAVCGLSDTTAWIVGSGGLAARTDDGGLTWSRERPDLEADWAFSYTACHFTDAANGWIAGGSGIFRRTGEAAPAPPPSLPSASSLAVEPASVVGGERSTGTVTLSAPAPAGGADVVLSTSNTTYSSVPASVHVAAGQTSATFTAQTYPVGLQTATTVRGVYNGTSASAVLTIKASPPPPPQTSEVVTLTRAEYTVSKRQLRVDGTTTLTGATVRVYVTATNALIGTLEARSNRFGGQLSWPTNPQSITVVTSGGGWTTATVTVK